MTKRKRDPDPAVKLEREFNLYRELCYAEFESADRVAGARDEVIEVPHPTEENQTITYRHPRSKRTKFQRMANAIKLVDRLELHVKIVRLACNDLPIELRQELRAQTLGIIHDAYLLGSHAELIAQCTKALPARKNGGHGTKLLNAEQEDFALQRISELKASGLSQRKAVAGVAAELKNRYGREIGTSSLRDLDNARDQTLSR